MHERTRGTGEPPAERPEDTDDNVTLDAEDDDWGWRRRIRSNPASHRLYRLAVGIVGLLIVVGGLIAVPAPGPGWLIVFVGVSIWASEFEWAQRLLRWSRDVLAGWTRWVRSAPWWVRAGVALGTAALVAAVFWAYLAWRGPPALLPDGMEGWLRLLPGVDPDDSCQGARVGGGR
jgi:uncharacterized protein (TIGR02611 family)